MKYQYVLFLVVPLVLFFSMTGNLSAQDNHVSDFSIESLLDHNLHLLTNTTLSTALIDSNSKEAKALFDESINLFIAAKKAYNSGLTDLSRKYSRRSITLFYRSDRVHYGLYDPDKNFSGTKIGKCCPNK